MPDDKTMHDNKTGRYPNYDVLRKRNSVSWNDRSRQAVDRRLAVDRTPHTFSEAEFRTLDAICSRIIPQTPGPDFVPLAAYIDQGLTLGLGPGYRHAELPPPPDAWKRGLAALDADSRRLYGKPFADLDDDSRDAMLRLMQQGELHGPEWEGLPPKIFFSQHILSDIVTMWAAHPTAWSRMGWGGPASPRGYVRMGFDMRDPWEAAEAQPGKEEKAAKENARVR
jgi:hypothetical protein